MKHCIHINPAMQQATPFADRAGGVKHLALALLASLTLLACTQEQGPAAGGAQQQAPAPVVSVIVTEAVDVPVVTELPGRTAASLVAEVRPQVTGIIERRAFEEGTEVKAGDLLYQIDPATYKAAFDSARASLARAEANAASARLTARRYEGLAKIDAVSQQARDDASAALSLAEADVAAAKAALERARIDVAYTKLTAPIGGRIGRSTVTAGALVTANQANALATIQQLDPIYVDLTQSSTELLRLRRDLEAGRIMRTDEGEVAVRLVLEDGSEYRETGRLEFSEVAVDTLTGSVTLRALFPNPSGELLPGMYVRARIQQGVKSDVFLLPHAALGRDPRGNAYVMVVTPEGLAESRIVRADRSMGEHWVITEGLKPGEQVIVEGLQRVRPGAPAQAEAMKPAEG